MTDKGQTLNSRYRIIRHICSGGMGGVYEAFDVNLKAHVALKESFFEEESLRVAFQREAQLLANLRHQSLPYCSDFFSHGTKLYLIMEFVEGDDLAALLSKRRAPFEACVVLEWARQMLDVLEYLHGEGVLHRDIKPSNIKVVRGRVYLLDLGIAYGQSGEMDTITGDDFNWHSHSIYSSPEQSRCERTSPASDLYSLAATLYKLLTNIRPVDAQSRFRALACSQGDPLKDIKSHCPDLDWDVRRTIMRTLSMDALKRPQSAREMRELMFPTTASRPVPKAPRVSLRTKIMACLCALVAASCLLLPAFAYRESASPSAASSTNEVAAALTNPYEDEADRLVRNGKYEEAARMISEALSVAPSSAYLRFVYGDLLWDMNDEGSESAADMAGVQEQAELILGLVQTPASEKEFVARSWASLAKGDLDSARADADEALRLNPNSGPGLMLRGTARYEQAVLSDESLKSAAPEILADYDAAVERMSNYPQVYINRARIRAVLGDTDLAVADIKQAIKLLPRAGNFYELGCAYYGSGRFEEARGSFRKAIALNPNHYKSHCGLGDIRFKQGDWTGALAEYLSANRIQETVYASGQIGWAYKNLGQFEDAKKNFDAALRRNRYDFISHYGLASVHVGLKDFKSALDSYNNALAYAPKADVALLSNLHRERARVLRELGQDASAEEDERRAEDLSH